ncbi:Hypothetical protein, putative, partial [Bodo saltans]
MHITFLTTKALIHNSTTSLRHAALIFILETEAPSPHVGAVSADFSEFYLAAPWRGLPRHVCSWPSSPCIAFVASINNILVSLSLRDAHVDRTTQFISRNDPQPSNISVSQQRDSVTVLCLVWRRHDYSSPQILSTARQVTSRVHVGPLVNLSITDGASVASSCKAAAQGALWDPSPSVSMSVVTASLMRSMSHTLTLSAYVFTQTHSETSAPTSTATEAPPLEALKLPSHQIMSSLVTATAVAS